MFTQKIRVKNLRAYLPAPYLNGIIKRIKIVYLLDYLEYNREESIKLLKKEYGFDPYGEKHCESTWTWWFQNYYLFTKFGIDKRKAHLSSEIVSGQITREKALAVLAESPVYPELGIEEKVLKYPKKDYKEFKTDEKLYLFISKLVKWFY
jgi:aminotransferase